MTEQDTGIVEQRLSDALEEIAATEPPAPTVTVAGVIASGRRLRRRRTRTLSAGVGVVAAATAAAVVFATGGSAPHAAAKPTGTASQVPAAGRGIPAVTFGWLPTWATGQSGASWSLDGPAFAANIDGPWYLHSEGGPETYAVFAQSADNDESALLTLYLHPAGAGLSPSMLDYETHAGTVDGHQAWWVADGAPGTVQPQGELALAWQYAPNAWAMLAYDNGSGDRAAGAMMLKVAQNLRYGESDPRTVPFVFTELPGGLHPDSLLVDLRESRTQGSGSVILCTTSPCTDHGGSLVVTQEPDDWTPGMQTQETYGDPTAPSLKSPHHTTVSVAGHSAKLFTSSAGATLTFDYDGSTVVIASSGDAYRRFGGLDGFLAFCRSVEWLGGNPADWSAHYLP